MAQPEPRIEKYAKARTLIFPCFLPTAANPNPLLLYVCCDHQFFPSYLSYTDSHTTPLDRTSSLPFMHAEDF